MDASGEPDGEDGRAAPRVWMLSGHRAGDTAQMRALAEALEWPFEVKQLVYRPTELASNLLLGPTLAGIDRRRSSPLAPPWPDLVISAGRRNEPVARWIRARARGRTRLVHFGRPWARIERFDLVITTPQYALPPRANVLRIELPLHLVTRQRLAEAGAEWSARLRPLPRPRIAVLVGGDSPPYRFAAAAAARLGRAVSEMAAGTGGSLLVTTSARTSARAAAELRNALDAPAEFFGWTPEAADNPYLGYLALADAIVVTGDSVSMVAEACATDAPVYIFDPGQGPSSMRAPGRGHPLRDLARGDAWTAYYRTVHRLAPARMRRDIGAMLRELVASGRAAWLGDALPTAAARPLGDLSRAAARVRALLEEAAGPETAARSPARAGGPVGGS